MKPIVIAFHLPQFHPIPDNNLWWGNGYTEWVRVKAAKPLFKGHNQPRVPINENYYNLLDKSTLAWQQSLARQHNVGAFCFYHYWFNGKQLLEKPVDSLLKSPELTFPFCLAWANEPWTRSWDGSSGEILVEQIYGEKNDWLNHIAHLAPFFCDPRYLRLNNKPIFLIYRSQSIPCLAEMLSVWNRYLQEKNIEQLHILTMNTAFGCEKRTNIVNGSIDFEPMYTLRSQMSNFHYIKRKIRSSLFLIGNKISSNVPFIRRRVNYSEVWNQILKRQLYQDRMLGAFVDWDNSPRKGLNGVVFEGATPELFFENFNKQYKRSIQANHPFLFVNAWNEWSEGAYLEPDRRFGMSFLEAINNAVNMN